MTLIRYFDASWVVHTHYLDVGLVLRRVYDLPEVTDPFCRLPLSTLFYRLEAVHLGDLMRL